MPKAFALSGGLVVTSLSPPVLLAEDLVVEDGRVASMGGAGRDVERVDARGCLIVPGNVCAHHHLYSALARGMPYDLEPPRNFVQVLQRVWWRLDRALDLAGVEASALAGGADALLAGTTTVVDHHASPNAIEGSLSRIADGLEGLGLRSVLCYEVTDRDGPERAQAGIDENRRFLEEARDRDRTGAMVGAHASFTLLPETREACAALAGKAGVGLHIHVAEDAADQADSMARFGVRVVERLASTGVLDERSLLAHCIHLDPEEVEQIGASGAWAAHNPRSNMNNRVGHMDVGAFDPARVPLGTDGIGGDMFAESKAGFWRAREADPETVPQWSLDRLSASARFASTVLGEPLLGTLEPGAPADLVVLDYAPPTPLTSANLAGHWVFALSSRMVRDVYVAGEAVVRGRQLQRIEKWELTSRCAGQARRLWGRLAEVEVHGFDPVGVS